MNNAAQILLLVGLFYIGIEYYIKHSTKFYDLFVTVNLNIYDALQSWADPPQEGVAGGGAGAVVAHSSCTLKLKTKWIYWEHKQVAIRFNRSMSKKTEAFYSG